MALQEKWKNNTRGKHGVIKLDRFGNEIHEIVGPGKTVQLTTDERKQNQERAAHPKMDIFTNGSMSPVVLLDEEDKAEFANNPNLMTDTDLKALFKLHPATFKSKVGSIDNSYTLIRLREIAQDPDVGATVAKLKVVEDRLYEVNPNSPVMVTQTVIPGARPKDLF